MKLDHIEPLLFTCNRLVDKRSVSHMRLPAETFLTRVQILSMVHGPGSLAWKGAARSSIDVFDLVCIALNHRLGLQIQAIDVIRQRTLAEA